MLNDVSLKVDGQKLTGWTDVSIKRSVDTVAGSFKFSVVDIWRGDAIYLEPQMEVDVYIGDDHIIRGYLEERDISIGTESNSISLSGRCRTGDLVDCSILDAPGSWKEIDPLKLITTICDPFDIKVIRKADLGEKLQDFSINGGESVYEAITRICENRAILPISDAKGNLVLTTIGDARASDKLIYEYNIISAQLSQNYKDRFSHVLVKGQQGNKGNGWDKGTTGIFGKAEDENVDRWRPKIIVPGSGLTNEGAKTRAAWETQIRAGRSSTIQVNIAGWRQYTQELWRENLIVFVVIPHLGVEGDMLVKDVEYTLNSTGRSLSMGLVLPEIYAPEPKVNIKKKKSKRNTVIWR